MVYFLGMLQRLFDKKLGEQFYTIHNWLTYVVQYTHIREIQIKV